MNNVHNLILVPRITEQNKIYHFSNFPENNVFK